LLNDFNFNIWTFRHTFGEFIEGFFNAHSVP